MNAKRIISLLLTALFLTPWAVAQEGNESIPFGDHEVFTDGFPRTLLFRKDNIVNWDQRGVLDQYLGMYDADTRKYVGEETTFKPEWIKLMSGFKERHPRKLSLIHLNGEARGVYRKEGHKYFPGHWMLYPGEILNHDLSSKDREISVASPDVFSKRTYHKRERGKLTKELLPPVVIVPFNPDGTKNWALAEYAEITEIDDERNVIELGDVPSRVKI